VGKKIYIRTTIKGFTDLPDFYIYTMNSKFPLRAISKSEVQTIAKNLKKEVF
jgi:hypothetical protein